MSEDAMKLSEEINNWAGMELVDENAEEFFRWAAKVSKCEAVAEAIKNAPKTKNRSNIACLVYTTQIDDALADLKDRSPSQAWLRKMSDAEDQIEGGVNAGNMEDGK